MSTPIHIDERHCVVMSDGRGILETDGEDAVKRMTELLLSKLPKMEERKLFEPAPTEEFPEDAVMLIGPEEVKGKRLSEIDPKTLEMIASVWKIYPEESQLVDLAKAVRKRRKSK